MGKMSIVSEWTVGRRQRQVKFDGRRFMTRWGNFHVERRVQKMRQMNIRRLVLYGRPVLPSEVKYLTSNKLNVSPPYAYACNGILLYSRRHSALAAD